MLAHRLAAENPIIQATCVEATEFIDLSRWFNVTGVPKTIVNDSIEILGALPEDQFAWTVVGAPARRRGVCRVDRVRSTNGTSLLPNELTRPSLGDERRVEV